VIIFLYVTPELNSYFAPPINGFGPPRLWGLWYKNHQDEDSESILYGEFNFYKSTFFIFLGV